MKPDKKNFELFNEKFNALIKEINTENDIYFTSSVLPEYLLYWLKQNGEFKPDYYPILDYGLTHYLANLSAYESFKFLIPALEHIKLNVKFYKSYDYDDFVIKNIRLQMTEEIHNDLLFRYNKKTKIEKLSFTTQKYEKFQITYTVKDNRLHTFEIFQKDKRLLSVSYTKDDNTGEFCDVTNQIESKCVFNFGDTLKLNRLYLELISLYNNIQEEKDEETE